MKRMIRHLHCCRVALCTGAITLLVQVASVRAQEPPSLPHQVKFADAGGVRLHYIDFGGEGLPVILVPAVTRDATHYGPLGPLLTAPNRVLAITRRGDGESEDPGGPYDAQTQARDFLQFMDALEIPQAVFVSNVGDEITYLAEEHPHRVAGLVFLGGPARGATGAVLRTEPTGMAEALRRLWQSAAGLPSDYFGYVPRYLESDTPTIGAPALAFVTTDGTRGVERENPALLMVGSPLASETVRGLRPEDGREHFERLADDPEYRHRTLAAIEDSVARSYFQRLARDAELQAQVHRFQEETLMPAEIAHWNAFRRAFAGTLRVVQLDVPAVSGYEYNSAPELIAPHIRRFLEELGRRLDGQAVESAVRGYLNAHAAMDSELLRASTTDRVVEGMDPTGSLPFNTVHVAGETVRAETASHTVRFIDISPEVRLEVLDWGGSGDALVFLAGLSNNAHAFDGFAPRFTDRHRVLGITRRGHGASSWPESGYDLDTLVGDIFTVLDSLGIRQAIFAGHSFGGSELTRLAAQHPDRALGLIYIDAVQDLTHIEAALQHCPFSDELDAAVQQQFADPEAFRRTQLRTQADGSVGPNVSVEAMPRLIQVAMVRDYSPVQAPALAVSYVPERLAEIFLGRDVSDECVTVVQRITYGGLAAFAAGMQRGTVVALRDGQHNLHLVSPDALETIMRRWLDRIER